MKNQNFTTQFSQFHADGLAVAAPVRGACPGARPTCRLGVIRVALGSGFGLAALAVVMFTAIVFQLPPPGQGPTGSSITNWAGLPRARGAAWYLHSGQLRADTRTAMAVIRYVLSPVPADVAYPMIAGFVRPISVATATNSSTSLPRA